MSFTLPRRRAARVNLGSQGAERLFEDSCFSLGLPYGQGGEGSMVPEIHCCCCCFSVSRSSVKITCIFNLLKQSITLHLFLSDGFIFGDAAGCHLLLDCLDFSEAN